MNIDEIYAGKYLKAASLTHWPMLCTIQATEIVTYDDGKRSIGLHLGEFPDKVLGLNKTNVERIRLQLGDDWEHAWLGKQLTLILENVEFQGKIIPAIRIQMPQPVAQPQPVAPPQPVAQLQPNPAPQPNPQPQQPSPQPPGSFEQAMDESGYPSEDEFRETL